MERAKRQGAYDTIQVSTLLFFDIPCKKEYWLHVIRLKTGWSFRTQNQSIMTHAKKEQLNIGISELEFSEIENVIKRAELAKKKELTRVTKLYERFEYVNRPHGDGKSSCFLCGNIFGTFSSKPHVCCICSQVS